MSRKIRQTVRDRRLTDAEAAKYREIRALVADEFPEIKARAMARLRELREAREVFAELRKIREAKGLTLADLADVVNATVREHGRCLLVVSEGFPVGDLGELRDSFGHTTFSSSKATVERVIVNYLNERGLPTRGAARGNTPGTDQRHNMIYASTVDLEEAYRVGQKAAQIAADHDDVVARQY